MNPSRTRRAVGLLWSLVLGIGLTLALVWALAPGADAQARETALDPSADVNPENPRSSSAIDQSSSANGPSRFAEQTPADPLTVIDPAASAALAEDLAMNVNYGHDSVEGEYEAGHTVWITVTESDSSTVKATAALQTQEIEWWEGATGFSTNLDYAWQSDPPDIVSGDWVFLKLDVGYTRTVRVGDIIGELDIGSDTVSGAISAYWLQDLELNGNCGVWEEGGPGETFTVTVGTAGGTYLCDFSGEWDLQPGHTVRVQYQELDGDWVGNVFREPAPELSIQKWATSGPAVPGGTFLYGISYYNGGDAAADDTVITDTLPSFTSFAADTSGLPVVDAGDTVTWDVGTVEPNSGGQFFVALNIDPSAPLQSLLEPNQIVIATTGIGDDLGNNYSNSDEVQVDWGEVDLWVNKGANPSDPLPGEQFAYFIEYGSGGGAATGPAWLTDTLPPSTSFVGWQEEQGWQQLWTEVMTTGGQFVLFAPAGIPGDMGGRIRLTLELDPAVELGTVLRNYVEISTEDDVDLTDNWYENADARASSPRYDMRVDKWYSSGVLVPDGWIGYGISYQNQGNDVVHAWLTDTLPPGTTYQDGSSGRSTDWGWEPFPPTVDGDTLVWDLGMVQVNEGADLSFALNLSEALEPGTSIVNCATVGIDEPEDTPWDNSACTEEEVIINEPGPNLRVRKWHQWQDGGRLDYQVRFENIGTEPVNDVWITDSLPVATAWDGRWDMDFDWERLESSPESPDPLVWHASELYPGDSGWLYFSVSPDDLAPLQWYTNTVEISGLAEDITVDDFYQDVAFSGGEVQWVELYVGGTHIWGQGYTHPVTVTTPSASQVFEDSDGYFEWDFEEPLLPGDIITVEAGAGTLPVVIEVPDPFTAHASYITDTVWGQIDHLSREPVEVALADGPTVQVLTDSDGYYTVTLDIPHGGQGEVRYRTQIDYAEITFHREFSSLDLIRGGIYLPLVLRD